MSNTEFIYNPPKEPFLDILYEDDYIIVVNKPSGILSVPGKKEEHFDSILYRVKSTNPEAGAVHRLDMSTSGVMVVSKVKIATGRLGKQFQDRVTDKIYFAWVGGKVEKNEGVIKLPLCVDWENRPLQKVDFENGREAITHYECLWKSEEKSFMKLHPYTGRSHQLRVHMKELGHPILGDHLYAESHYRDMAPHLYLHAGYLSFYHPISNQKMEFKTNPCFDIPKDIRLF